MQSDHEKKKTLCRNIFRLRLFAKTYPKTAMNQSLKIPFWMGFAKNRFQMWQHPQGWLRTLSPQFLTFDLSMLHIILILEIIVYIYIVASRLEYFQLFEPNILQIPPLN